MRISRIYFEGFLRKGENIDLPIESSHYIMHVLRLKMGANVILFNGDGNEYDATLIDLQRKTVTLKVGESFIVQSESPLKLMLAQGILRSEKMDWAIQKAVELGVHEITPLITDFCSLRLNEERASKRLNHWKKIIISASEQSRRTTLPTLNPIIPFREWVHLNLEKLLIYCDPEANKTMASLPQSQLNEVVILIGPEGGLSPKEVRLAKENNFIGVSLGPRILRTETATLAAITLLQNRWGDL